ncbi:MAG: GAF domain-containing protein [Anaerolineales bacterium]|nr:GAF domain-containing protein [Anaerolineales bacterium]
MTLPKHASAERRAVLLDTAAHVAKAVSSILDPDQLLQRIVDIICTEFGFYYAGVFLVDESGVWARLHAGYGPAGQAMLEEGHRLQVGGNSMIGTCIDQHKARIALDVGAEAVRFQNPHLPQTRSEMALPLMTSDEMLGALTVQSEKEAAFTQEDIAILQSMADQLAIAIQNARLHRRVQELLRQTERRARLLQAAHDVGKEVTSILDINTLLPMTVDIICDSYGFYYAGVFLLDRSGEWAVLRAGRGEAGAAMIAEGHRLQVGGPSMIGASIYLRQALIALDVGEEAVHFKNPHLPHTRSEMALPLLVGDQALGAVTVQSVEERAFSSDDITTLQTMADQLAIAIRNAQLLEELDHAHAELLRTKTYEALATATTEAVHWIGNKALPITITSRRMREDLRSGVIDPQSLAEDLGLIEQGAQGIVEVKENLLGSAREQKPRPLMLDDLWRTAACHRQMPADRLQISVHPDTPLALGDSTQLVRAFGNLLQNAMESGASQISVEIAPAEEPGYVITRLSDNGLGIPVDIQDKVWAAFFTTKSINHHGLGLSACLHIITQLGGRIMLYSQPGQGTTITILLPASLAEPEPVDLSVLPEIACLIDDADRWAEYVCGLFASAHKHITREVSLKRMGEAEVILVDEAQFSAPAMQTLLSLKKAGLAGKVILLAAALRVEQVTEYLQLGVRDVVLKPYTPVELAKIFTY